MGFRPSLRCDANLFSRDTNAVSILSISDTAFFKFDTISIPLEYRYRYRISIVSHTPADPPSRFPSGRPVSYERHVSSFFGVYEAFMRTTSIRLFSFYWPPKSALKVCQYISGTPCTSGIQVRIFIFL